MCGRGWRPHGRLGRGIVGQQPGVERGGPSPRPPPRTRTGLSPPPPCAGEGELPGLTDEEKPRQRGPKRASKIRRMFNLTKDDDVRHYVKIYGKKVEKVRGAAACVRVFAWRGARRCALVRVDPRTRRLCSPPPPVPPAPARPPPQNGKTSVRCPKIQRLVTPQVLQRKRRRASEKKSAIVKKKAEAAEYHKLLVTRLKEQRERRWVLSFFCAHACWLDAGQGGLLARCPAHTHAHPALPPRAAPSRWPRSAPSAWPRSRPRRREGGAVARGR